MDTAFKTFSSKKEGTQAKKSIKQETLREDYKFQKKVVKNWNACFPKSVIDMDN